MQLLMNKYHQILGCKLGEEAISQVNRETLGIGCKSSSLLLQLFYFAANQNCDLNKCSLETNIGKITKHCKDCKPYPYKHVILQKNDDYTDWYNSPEYLECLAIQLETQGWIQPMVAICGAINIEISQEQLCKAVINSLVIAQEDCNVVSSISMEKHCNTVINSIIMQNTDCKTPAIQLSQYRDCVLPEVQITEKSVFKL